MRRLLVVAALALAGTSMAQAADHYSFEIGGQDRSDRSSEPLQRSVVRQGRYSGREPRRHQGRGRSSAAEAAGSGDDNARTDPGTRRRSAATGASAVGDCNCARRNAYAAAARAGSGARCDDSSATAAARRLQRLRP